jgi:hypothetical protein
VVLDWLQLADKEFVSEDAFNSLRREARLIWRQYAAPSLNEFKRINPTQFDSPFADPTGYALDQN